MMSTERLGPGEFSPSVAPTPERQAWVMRLGAGAALISLSPVFVTLANAPPAVTALYRVFLGGAALVVIAAIRRDRLWRDWSTFGLVTLAGGLLAIDLTLWHTSIELIGPGLSTILGNFQVFVLAGVGMLVLRERITPGLLAASPLAMLGLVLIFGLDWSALSVDYRLGIAFGLLTAITYGGFLLVLRYLQSSPDALSAFATIGVLSLISAVFLAFYVWGRGESFLVPDRQTAFAVVGYAAVSHVVAWALITRALPYVPVSQTGLLLLLQPSLAFFWDVLFFGHTLVVTEVIGVGVVLGAIYMGAVKGRPRTP